MSISGQNLSIVIVTLKSNQVIHQCIKSINHDLPIIIIENSYDKSLEEIIKIIRSKYPEIIINFIDQNQVPSI